MAGEQKGKAVAVIVFVLIVALIGYLAYKKWGKNIASVADPRKAAVRAAWEAEMLGILRQSVTNNNPADEWARVWYNNIVTKYGGRTPTDQELLSEISYAGLSATGTYQGYVVADLYR